MKNGSAFLAVLGLTAGLFAATSAQAAGGLLFLSDTAAARMSDEDFKLMTKAAVAALDDATVPSLKVWSNPKTGSGGTVKTVQAFPAKSGEACKVVEHSTQAKSLAYEASSTVCKVKGKWKLASEDFAKAPTATK